MFVLVRFSPLQLFLSRCGYCQKVKREGTLLAHVRRCDALLRVGFFSLYHCYCNIWPQRCNTYTHIQKHRHRHQDNGKWKDEIVKLFIDLNVRVGGFNFYFCCDSKFCSRSLMHIIIIICIIIIRSQAAKTPMAYERWSNWCKRDEEEEEGEKIVRSRAQRNSNIFS